MPDSTPGAVTPASGGSEVARAVVDALAAAGETVATAESLTGGLVVATLVDVPGASRVVRGGIVAYATDLKASLVGVSTDVLARGGAVQAEVALELARGARLACGATWGIGTTGVAGPDPADGRQAGTVFVAVDGPAPSAVPADDAPGRATGTVDELLLHGDRAAVRAGTVDHALGMLLRRAGGALPTT